MVDRLGSGIRRMIAAGTAVVALSAGCSPPEQQPLPTTTVQATRPPEKTPTAAPTLANVLSTPTPSATETAAPTLANVLSTPTPSATEAPPPTKESEVISIAGEVFYRQNHDFDCTVAAGAAILEWAKDKYPQVKEALQRNIDPERWEKALESLRNRHAKIGKNGEINESDIFEEYILQDIPFSPDPNNGFSGDPDDFVDYEHNIRTTGVYVRPVAAKINTLLAGSGVRAIVVNLQDERIAYNWLETMLSSNIPVVALGNGKNRSMGKMDVTDPSSGGRYSLVPNLHAEIIFGTVKQGTGRRYLINTGGDYGRSENRLYHSKTINGWGLTDFEAMAIQPE